MSHRDYTYKPSSLTYKPSGLTYNTSGMISNTSGLTFIYASCGYKSPSCGCKTPDVSEMSHNGQSEFLIRPHKVKKKSGFNQKVRESEINSD